MNSQDAASSERDVIRRSILKHTPPLPSNPKISFSEGYALGRIVIAPGIRMIDWNGQEWDVFIKEGASWFRDEMNDNDFSILQDVLADDIRSIFE